MNDDFASLPLDPRMLETLASLGYERMTPVQALSLPALLQGRDVVARARTGSGKTAAFGIALLSRLRPRQESVGALVLCPTRELSDQVARELRRLARFEANIKILTLCGGTPVKPQRHSLSHGAAVVVGTPGRVLQHLEEGGLKLDALQTLVLDEADRMLDMGFSEAVEQILSHAPAVRQNLLFSATFPEALTQLGDTVMRDPVRVEAPEPEDAAPIEEHLYALEQTERFEALLRLLGTHRPERCIVFCNTKLLCRDVAAALRDAGVDALALHGDLEQYERIDVLVQFSNRSCVVLVATDVAARGLDIKELEAVINYELPRDRATYTHRIGRTGRAGMTGVALSLLGPEDAAWEAFYADAESLPAAAGAFTLLPPNVTLVIEGGKKEKLRPGDLLGALCGGGAIPAAAVGNIDIYERQSYVAVAREWKEKAYKALKEGTIKARRFSVWTLE